MIRISANVNRKDCADFNSRSYGATVEVELASGDGAKIKATLDRLYAELDEVVDRQFENRQQRPTQTAGPNRPNASSQRTSGSGNGNGNGNGGGITQAQLRAVYAIAKSVGINGGLDAYLRPFGVESPEKLTVKQASALIDQLKGIQGTGAPRNGGQS